MEDKADKVTCKQNTRKSNFEIMRIFAIITIILSHYVIFGQGEMTLPRSDFYMIFSHFIGGFGKLGVMLFILITGYFMIERSNISIKNVLRLVIDTLFYSWFFLIVFMWIFPNYIILNPFRIYKYLLPVSTGWVWFIPTYLLLYILIPLINKIFNFLPQKIIKFYLILFGVLWYIIPTFSYKISYCFSEFAGFVYLYFIGAYIKKYGINFFESAKNRIIVSGLSCCAIITYLAICNHLHLIKYKFWLHFTNEQSIFCLLLAISIFYFCKNMKIKSNKYINLFASSVLSVYLIHTFLGKELFTKIFHCCDSASISYLIYNMLIMVVSLFIFSAIFDKIKNKLVTDRLNKFIAERKFVKFVDETYFKID